MESHWGWSESTKIGRDRPLSQWRFNVDQCDLKSGRNVAGWKNGEGISWRNTLFYFVDYTRRRTNIRNILKRFHEIPRIVRSRRGASGLWWEDSKEIQSSGEAGPLIPSHRSRRIYAWYRVSGTWELKPQRLYIQSTEITRRDKIRFVI